MAYKTLLTLVEGVKSAEACRRAAFILAQQQQAFVAGLSLAVMPRRATYLSNAALAEVLVEQESAIEQESETRAMAFNEALVKQGLSGECRAERCFESDLVASISLDARYADLIIMGQAGAKEADNARRALPENLVLGAGRPVLLVPSSGLKETLGKRVAVAWDGGREAARAAADALPLLTQAEEVEVVVIDPEKKPERHGAEPGADFARYLVRHGCNVSVKRMKSGDLSIGDCLLAHLKNSGADLLVMGAYAHPRLRELVLGGVTEHVLARMSLPLLLSH